MPRSNSNTLFSPLFTDIAPSNDARSTADGTVLGTSDFNVGSIGASYLNDPGIGYAAPSTLGTENGTETGLTASVGNNNTNMG